MSCNSTTVVSCSKTRPHWLPKSSIRFGKRHRPRQAVKLGCEEHVASGLNATVFTLKGDEPTTMQHRNKIQTLNS